MEKIRINNNEYNKTIGELEFTAKELSIFQFAYLEHYEEGEEFSPRLELHGTGELYNEICLMQDDGTSEYTSNIKFIISAGDTMELPNNINNEYFKRGDIQYDRRLWDSPQFFLMLPKDVFLSLITKINTTKEVRLAVGIKTELLAGEVNGNYTNKIITESGDNAIKIPQLQYNAIIHQYMVESIKQKEEIKISNNEENFEINEIDLRLKNIENNLKEQVIAITTTNSISTQKYYLLFVILGGWSLYVLYIIFMK